MARANPLTRGKGRKVGLHRKASAGSAPKPGKGWAPGDRWGPGPNDVIPGGKPTSSRGTPGGKAGSIPQADGGRRGAPTSRTQRSTVASAGRSSRGAGGPTPTGMKNTRPVPIGSSSTMGKGSIPQADGGRRTTPPSSGRVSTGSVGVTSVGNVNRRKRGAPSSGGSYR